LLLTGACGRVRFDELDDATTIDGLPALCADLVGHFKLDEIGGPSALDSVSQANASVQGTVSFDPAAGVVGGAATFTTDGYIDVARTQDFPAADFTWAVWVKPTDLVNRTVFQVRNGAGGRALYVKWTTPTDLEVVIDDTSVFNDVPGFLDDSTWQHVALTRSGDALTLYRNGAVLSTATHAGPIDFLGCVYRIGSITDCTGSAGAIQVWEGQLDDLRVYRRALEPQEVDLLHSASRAGTVPPC
jgi:hypothetical protein